MTNRRDFLQNLLLAGPALFIGANTSASGLHGNETVSDWESIRLQYPLDKNLVFLNNGTMGPSPYAVIEAVRLSMMEVDRQANYGGWFDVNTSISAYFHAEESEICLTHNVTDGINIVAQGLPLKKGDEIIISNHEHVGNALPWLARARRDKLVIKVLDLSLPTPELLTALKKLIGKRTRVIALPHVPCTTGRILPVKEIGVIARENELYYFLDGAHGAGMLALDFRELDCDFYATCTHKWLCGPKGTGFLYIKKEKLQELLPIFTGAFSDKGWNLTDGNPRILGWADEAKRHFNGTQNRSLYDGVKAAIEFQDRIGKEKVSAHIRELNDILYEQLIGINGIQILTPQEERAGMLSFRFDKKDYMEFQQLCQTRNVIIRAVPENDVNAIRLSTHIYNNPEEIGIFVELLKQYLHG